ncbi:MAG: B12-binding domain-containing radical SAM protein [Candidatus Altiarchaeota archaeon]|nr:B12-binding domain-containing radical SAM protein [Candidatus Altiarchaeota archaeon]
MIFPETFEKNLSPPLGISIIAACLRDAGYEVELWDQTVEHRKKINWGDYFLVGMNLLCANFNNGVELAKRIREGNSNVFIMAGGPFSDTCAQEVLESGVFDAIVHGEGEYTFVRLAKAVKGKKAFHNIKGLSFYKQGKIKRTDDPPLIKDLDKLPFPAYDLLPVDKYPEASVIASRGCPFSCIFCTRGPAESKKRRCLSPARAVEWIALLREKYHFKHIRMVDSTFTVDQKWAEEICDLIIKNNLRVHWSCQTRIDCINTGLLEKMKKAGCNKIIFGIESGNDKILTLMEKGFTKNNVRAFAKMFKAADAPSVTANFIIGHSWDTRETIRETFDFAKELNNNFGFEYRLFLLVPFPGTELWNNPEKYGIKIGTDWKHFCKTSFFGNPLGVEAVYSTNNLSSGELTEIYHQLQNPVFSLMMKYGRPTLLAVYQIQRLLDRKLPKRKKRC